MFHVYIIQSLKTKRYYTGYSANVERRLIEHNSNNTKSLKNRGPFKLIYSEAANSLIEARRRERQIKSYKGGVAFKKLISSKP